MLLLLACAAPRPSATDPTPADTASRAGDGVGGFGEVRARGVIVVHADTLRADHLPMYGYARDTLPSLSGRPALAVDDYRTAAPWTIPSTVSALTGLEVVTHGATHGGGYVDGVIPVDAPTLAESFEAAGFRTLAVIGNDAFNEMTTGATRGFDTVNPLIGEVGHAPHAMGEIAEATLAWLDELPADAPFFVFAQPMDAHGPYSPHPDFLGTWSDLENLPFSVDATAARQEEQLLAAFAAAEDDAARAALRQATVDVYDETLLTLDRGLAALLDGLEARGRLDDTLVVFANDHGETLFDVSEGALLGHGESVREELLRGALLLLHPDLPAARVTCLSSSPDLAPTLLRATGAPPMERIDGIPLQETCRELVFASVFAPDRPETVPLELSVTDGRYTVRWRCAEGVEERYDLAADPLGLASIPADAVPDLARYTDALAAHLGVLRERLGAEGCAVTR